MKIGFFTDSYFPEIDGVTYTLKAWRDRLEERGHEVHIIYPGSPEYSSDKNEHALRSLPNPFYSGYRAPLFRLNFEFEELDIAHCHGPGPASISGLIYGYLHDTPKIYTHHTPVEEYFEQAIHIKTVAGFLKRIYMPMENYYLKKYDVKTASVGEPSRNCRFRQLPVGLNLEFFQPSDQEFKKEEDWDEPLLGYSGRMSMEKNLEEIVDFAEQFDGTVLLVGEGPTRQKIDRIKPENIYTFDFLPRDKLTDFYSTIDLYITASTGDTLGLSPLEANACGTPVIAPEVFPFNKTIKPENGMLYSNSSEEDLKQKVEEALDSDYSTREAVQKYGLNKTVDRLEKIYQEEIGK
ncbi:MAG: glycosyl transferase family 1 [Nanohaloarchaea archaeon SW_4_43_9]|nr:MAG: glycosyl transferase family 1 [Nanohaloarchaea archaeon SW_4_43_9]